MKKWLELLKLSLPALYELFAIWGLSTGRWTQDFVTQIIVLLLLILGAAAQGSAVSVYRRHLTGI